MKKVALPALAGLIVGTLWFALREKSPEAEPATTMAAAVQQFSTDANAPVLGALRDAANSPPEQLPRIQARLIREDPNQAEALAIATHALARLPKNEQLESRLSIIESVYSLHSEAERVRDLARSELTATVAPADADLDSDACQVPLVTHTLFLNTVTDPEDAIQSTLTGVDVQDNDSLRHQLFTGLLGRYPAAWPQILAEASARKIDFTPQELDDVPRVIEAR